MQHFFGTDGIRAKFGSGMLTPSSLQKLGHAIGAWITQKQSTSDKKVKILLTSDTRTSRQQVAASLCYGLHAHAIQVYDGGILPTGATSIILEHCNEEMFDLGIIISASHNPPEYNGMKFITATGKLTAEDEEAIEQHYYSLNNTPEKAINESISFPQAKNRYQNYLANLLPAGLLTKKKVILDCACGATSIVAPELFTQLGAEVIALNQDNNGELINQNCGALHPKEMAQQVVKHQADIGFAFDGDGDRIVMSNDKGVIYTGDHLLALLTYHPHYHKENTIVGTCMSNLGLEKWLAEQGKNLLRTDVGDKQVAHTLQKTNTKLGGEPSGHIITTNHSHTSDGLLTSMLLLETLISYTSPKASLPSTYPQTALNLLVKYKPSLSLPSIQATLTRAEKNFPQGRIIVRYSGTEPMLRIMTEGPCANTTERAAQALAHNLEKNPCFRKGHKTL